MLFSEPFFLFFFLPLLIIAYFLVPRIMRNTLLLLASLFFYAVGEKNYVFIMVISISINYIIGMGIGLSSSRKISRIFLLTGVVLDLGILLIFKYANFFLENVNILLTSLHFSSITYNTIHLPIGISFFTFQAMSYIIDVYRKDTECQKNPGKVALYISLFPQLIAGPIVRYSDVAYHLDHRTETLHKFSYGVRRFVIGLAKKMIIANTLAYPADLIFSLPSEELKFSISWLGVICYSLQIYFDFSGYSDMAIGLGRIFGFRFPENFNYPYISRSITEFWRRWHLSLSSWFRDYLYIPLGGNRISRGRTYFNLFTIFFLCGFWHGASWNFLVWGIFHGVLLIIERIGLKKWLDRRSPALRHGYVLFMVMIGWVFFRAENLRYAVSYLAVMFGRETASPDIRYLAHYLNSEVFLTIIIGILASSDFVKNILVKDSFGGVIDRLRRPVTFISITRVVYLSGIFFYSLVLLASGAYNPFIYFRF